MKTIVYGSLLSTLILVSCVKKPRACFTATNLPDTGIVETGSNLSFDAACSEGATAYQWRVMKDSSGVILEDNYFEGKKLSFTFLKRGEYQVRLMVTRKNKNGNSVGKTLMVR